MLLQNDIYYKITRLSNFLQSQARGTLRKPRDVSKIQTHHLFMCMRDFGYHIGEETEVFFSLYDAKNFKFVRYVCVILIIYLCKIIFTVCIMIALISFYNVKGYYILVCLLNF